MLFRLGAGSIADVEDHVRLHRLLQGGTEGFHQVMGQPADKAYRVDEQYLPAVRQPEGPGSGIQRGEELVLRQYARLGQGVEQGGFSRVGVADDGHRLDAVLFPALPAALPLLLHAVKLETQGTDPPADMPPVAFQLGFAGAAGANAAPQTRQGHALSSESGQQIL